MPKVKPDPSASGRPTATVRTVECASEPAVVPKPPWQDLIAGDQLAQLETSTVEDAEAAEVAAVCLRLAAEHSPAVERVLCKNKNVHAQALELLRPGEAGEPGQRTALALSFLQAGIDLRQQKLAPEVAGLLVERQRQQESWWEQKRDKHVPSPTAKAKPHFRTAFGFEMYKPFFHAKSEKYSLQNLNGKLPSPQDPSLMFKCRHLERASATNTKTFTGAMTRRDVSALDYKALEDAYDRQQRSNPTVNFSPGNFGALLRHMARGLGEGEQHSWGVNWHVDDHAKMGGHGMRVFIEKTRARTDPTGISRIKVGLYEPNVTGDISHLKVLPEHLTELNFDDFDKLGVRTQNGSSVLALEVDSWELARSCAGVYVNQDRPSQVDSLCEALAHGNTGELERAMAKLTHSSVALESKELKLLTRGLYFALQNGHADALEKFMAGLKRLGLPPEQIAELVAAKDDRQTPGLSLALENGHAGAVKEYMAGLKGLGLSFEQIAELLAAKDDRQTPSLFFALENGHADAVKEYMAGLKGMGLWHEQIVRLLAAKDGRQIPGLFFALQDGHADAVKEFMTGLQGLGLLSERIAELVAAKDGRQIPGLFFALQDGHADAVKEFMAGLKGLHLSSKQIAELVAATDGRQISGLRLARKNGHTITIAKYTAGLQGLGLSTEQIATLLAAKTSSGWARMRGRFS